MMRRATVAAALVLGTMAALPTVTATADDTDYSDARYAAATTVAVEGELVQVVSDDFESHTASHDYTLSIDDGPTIAVSLDDDVPAGEFTGEVVVDPTVARQNGLARGSAVDGDSPRGTSTLEALSETDEPVPVASASVAPIAPASAGPRAHRAYVAYMNKATPPAGAVENALSYWRTEAGGSITSFPISAQADFTSTAAGCGMATSASAAQAWTEAAAQFPGVSFDQSTSNHLIVMVPASCAYTGLGTLGTLGLASGGKTLVTSSAGVSAQTGVHELGHNFGLDHANQADRADGEYDDLYSPMGLGISGANPAFTSPALGTLYRHELDLTTSQEVVAVDPGAPRTFGLAARGSSTGVRGLLVTDPTDGEEYSIDWRPRTDRDEGAFYGTGYRIGGLPTYSTGVVIERQDGRGATFLETRQDGDTTYGSFGPGTTFDPSPGLSVTVTGITGSAAIVTVTFPQYVAPDPELPSFTGVPMVDETLWADPGEWPDGTDDFTYAWMLDGVESEGVADMFQVPPSAVGQQLRLDVTATPPGHTEAITRSSVARTVQPGTFSPGRITVGGVLAVGRTLTATATGWTSDTRLDHAWFVGSTRVGTGRTVVLPPSARGHAVVLRVTPVRTGYTSEPVTVTTRAVAAGSLSSTTPRVSGQAKVGRTLSAVPGTWSPRGVRLTYQWFANGRAIAKATGSRLTLTSSTVGKPISVRVTGTLTGYTTASRFSARTVRVVR